MQGNESEFDWKEIYCKKRNFYIFVLISLPWVYDLASARHTSNWNYITAYIKLGWQGYSFDYRFLYLLNIVIGCIYIISANISILLIMPEI